MKANYQQFERLIQLMEDTLNQHAQAELAGLTSSLDITLEEYQGQAAIQLDWQVNEQGKFTALERDPDQYASLWFCLDQEEDYLHYLLTVGETRLSGWIDLSHDYALRNPDDSLTEEVFESLYDRYFNARDHFVRIAHEADGLIFDALVKGG